MPVSFGGHITAYILNTYSHGGRVEVIDTRDYRTQRALSKTAYHRDIGEKWLVFNSLSSIPQVKEIYPVLFGKVVLTLTYTTFTAQEFRQASRRIAPEEQAS